MANEQPSAGSILGKLSGAKRKGDSEWGRALAAKRWKKDEAEK